VVYQNLIKFSQKKSGETGVSSLVRISVKVQVTKVETREMKCATPIRGGAGTRFRTLALSLSGLGGGAARFTQAMRRRRARDPPAQAASLSRTRRGRARLAKSALEIQPPGAGRAGAYRICPDPDAHCLCRTRSALIRIAGADTFYSRHTRNFDAWNTECKSRFYT
jgi:hypothetical protein